MDNPFLLQPKGRRLLTLVGIYIAFMVAVADGTSFGTILPFAIEELGGAELYALTTSIAGILGVVAMPLLAWVAVRYPHTRPYILGFGITLMAATLVLRAVAPSMGIVIIAKILESVGGTATAYVIGIPLVRDMFEPKKVGVLLGLVSTTTAIGTAFGPVLVGAIVDSMGWRAQGFVFALIAALAAVLVFLGARPKKEETRLIVQDAGRLDFVGSLLLTLFIAALVFSVSLGTGAVPFGTPLNTAFIVTAVVAFLLFIANERRLKDHAIIPTSTLRDRNTVMFAIQTFLASGSSIVVVIFVSYYILGVMGGTATQAGLASMAYSIPAFFLGPIVGRWIAKSGSVKGVIYLSSVFKISSMLILAYQMFEHGSTLSIWTVYGCMLVGGIFQGLNQPTVQSGPTLLLPADIRVRGNATIQMGISLGPMIGAAIFGSVVVGEGVERGVPVALVAAAIASVLVVVPVAFMRKRPPVEEQTELIDVLAKSR